MQSIGHIIDDFIIIFIHAFADPVEHNAYKAIFEKHMNLPKTDTLYGAIGIDINVDHIALCETNKDGNIQSIKRIQRINEMKNCISWPLKSWDIVNPRRRVW